MVERTAPNLSPLEAEMFRVLVVDDDADMVAYLAMILRKEGFDITTALNGNAVLSMVGASPPVVRSRI